MKKTLFLLAVVIITGSIGYFQYSNKVPPYDSAVDTYASLEKAIEGEVTAAAKYSAFAVAAGKERQTGIERMFNALAAAEQIHIDRMYEMANEMKALQLPTPKGYLVESTSTNLKSAIDGENYEANTLYPRYFKTAEEEEFTRAKTAFKYAREAEISHAEVMTNELSTLSTKGDDILGEIYYYVCPVCGRLEVEKASMLCPTCKTPGFMYDRF